MGSPAQPFKVAQEAALRASSDLTTAMGGKVRIYTEVPPNAPLPYIVIGGDQIILENDVCADEAEIFSTVNLWSRTNPLDHGVQARAIGSEVITALNQQLNLSGWTVDEWTVQSERYVTDPDGSSHGIITFQYLITEIVA